MQFLACPNTTADLQQSPCRISNHFCNLWLASKLATKSLQDFWYSYGPVTTQQQTCNQVPAGFTTTLQFMACTNTTVNPPKVPEGFSNTMQFLACPNTTVNLHPSPCRISNHFAIYGLHQHNSKLATKSLQDFWYSYGPVTTQQQICNQVPAGFTTTNNWSKLELSTAPMCGLRQNSIKFNTEKVVLQLHSCSTITRKSWSSRHKDFKWAKRGGKQETIFYLFYKIFYPLNTFTEHDIILELSHKITNLFLILKTNAWY